MKRIFTILSVCVYILLTVGIVKSEHHCMGQVKSLKYFSTTAEKCFDGEEDRNMPGCCSDHSEILSVDDDQFQSYFNIGFTKVLYIIRPVMVAEAWDFPGLSDHQVTYVTQGLPPPRPVDIYTFTSSYLHYG